MPTTPTRYVIMLDHHMPPGGEWPVVFMRDTRGELRAIRQYSRIWRWFPRHLFTARSTGDFVRLRHVPTGGLHPGKIYSFRRKGGS